MNPTVPKIKSNDNNKNLRNGMKRNKKINNQKKITANVTVILLKRKQPNPTTIDLKIIINLDLMFI